MLKSCFRILKKEILPIIYIGNISLKFLKSGTVTLLMKTYAATRGVTNINLLMQYDSGCLIVQGFFLCTSGAVYGPLSQCKIPKFFPNLIKKIPNQKINFISFISFNYSIFFHLEVISLNFKSNDIKLYDYM